MITLEDLRGAWRLERVIEDRRADLLGRMEGVCYWVPQTGHMVQAEEGTLRYGAAAPMRAERRYLWREEAGVLSVFFEDGRPFHTVPQDGSEAVHHCEPDLYRVRYHWDGAARFTTTWHVTGPRKDATITTIFTKTADHSAASDAD